MAERTLISWTAPNLITIPSMAFGVFLLVVIVVQLVSRALDGGGGAEPAPAGY